MLTRADILRPRERQYKTVSAFGGKIRLRQLFGIERAEFEDATMNMAGTAKDGLRRIAILIIYTAVDGEGDQLFTMDDVDEIANLPFDELHSVFMAAMRLNALTKEDVDSLGKG